MKDIKHILSDKIIKYIKNEIAEAKSNEVFFRCSTDDNKNIIEIETLARGNQFSVPAVIEKLNSGDMVLHNHPNGDLTPSSADNSIAAFLLQYGVASAIINNTVTEIYVQVELFDKIKIKKLDIENILTIIRPGGGLSNKLPGYENRSGQLKMCEHICETFNSNKISLIEAGTGIGKTISYLLPAIHWSVLNNEKCIITTNTINLQEQIVKKDIPFLKSILPVKFKSILLKGRNNYICLRKLNNLKTAPDLFDTEKNKELDIILKWVGKTQDGSLSDLNYKPSPDLWDNIKGEPEACMNTKCRYNRMCFINKIRRQANYADIIIVNHHLLFADSSVRYATKNYSKYAILPPYKRLVIDEAHNAEDVAIKYFGKKISRMAMTRLLGQLYRLRKNKPSGILKYLTVKIISECKFSDKIKDIILDKITNGLIPETNELITETKEIFNIIQTFATDFKQKAYNMPMRLRVTPGIEHSIQWKNDFEKPVKEFVKHIISYKNKIEDLKKYIKTNKNDSKYPEKTEEIIFDLNVQLIKILEKINIFTVFLEPSHEDPNIVKWFENRRYRNRYYTSLNSAPIDISKLFYESVILPSKSVVLTSATLTVRKKFDFIKNNLGFNYIDNNRLCENIFDSPFDYNKQTVLIVPQDIPEPNDPMFNSTLKQLIFQILSISQGKGFILFTSFNQLDLMYNELREAIEYMGLKVFKQGQLPRHKLLELFKDDVHSVLFGTSSFWEGVDVSGEALECVAICKLPFKVPDDPIVEAKKELIEKTGENAFFKYILPLATIKLKQGIGRLIRNRTDKGVIAIFDKRIKTKRYGKIFIESLPTQNIIYDSKDNCFNLVRKFFKNKN